MTKKTSKKASISYAAKAGSGQLKIAAFVDDDVVVRKFRCFSTDFIKVRVSSEAVEKFLRALSKKKKLSEEARHLKKCEWMMKKVRINSPKVYGDEWEQSVKTLFEKMFEDKWDKDFDKDGREKEFVMPKTAPMGVA